MSLDEAVLAELRGALTARADVLIARYQAIHKHLRGEDGRHDQDFSDRVAFNQMDEVLEALDDGGRHELLQIQAALHRMDDGSYGICAGCGDEVAEGRLRAVPFTALCVGCASTAQARR